MGVSKYSNLDFWSLSYLMVNSFEIELPCGLIQGFFSFRNEMKTSPPSGQLAITNVPSDVYNALSRIFWYVTTE